MRFRIASFPVHVEGCLICDELDDGGGPAEELGRGRAVAPQRPDERGPQLVVLPAVDDGVDGGLAEIQQDHKLRYKFGNPWLAPCTTCWFIINAKDVSQTFLTSLETYSSLK